MSKSMDSARAALILLTCSMTSSLRDSTTLPPRNRSQPSPAHPLADRYAQIILSLNRGRSPLSSEGWTKQRDAPVFFARRVTDRLTTAYKGMIRQINLPTTGGSS